MLNLIFLLTLFNMANVEKWNEPYSMIGEWTGGQYGDKIKIYEEDNKIIVSVAIDKDETGKIEFKFFGTLKENDDGSFNIKSKSEQRVKYIKQGLNCELRDLAFDIDGSVVGFGEGRKFLKK